MMKAYKYLDVITVFFVAILLISNIASTKILDLGFLTFDGGTLLFPLSYIFGDILTEVYGYRKTRKVIWLGFFSALLMSLTFYVIGVLPASTDWTFQEDYQNILGATWRIVLGSLLAYSVGEFSNSFVLSKLKVITNGKYLWVRTISSTLVGQLFDTLIFVLVAFYGIYETSLLTTIIISNYIFKCGLEILLTPVTYQIVYFLKLSEKEDYYDLEIDYNPFSGGD